MGSRNVFWLVLFAMFAAFAAATPAYAASAMVGQPLSTCIAPARDGVTPAAVFAGRVRFDCKTPQGDFGAGDYWVLSSRIPETVPGKMPLGVRTVSVWQQRVTLYALYPDGEIVRRVLDDASGNKYIQLGAIFMQRLPMRAHAPVRLAWRVEGAGNLRGVVLAPRIATPGQAAAANLTMAALYAGFAGLAVALLFHNLAMWRVLRQRFQLWYIAMLVSILAYACSSSGVLSWILPELPNTTRIRINSVALALTGVTAFGFARSFFEPRISAGWLGRSANVMSTILLCLAGLFALTAPWHIVPLNKLYGVAFLGLLCLAGPLVWRAWRLRSDYLWLFALAWAAPILLAALRIAHNLGLVAWSFWLDNSTLLVMGVEALGSSMAIAYRLRQLARERDDARAEEIAARLLADTDPLTGLLNRRAFLAQAIGRDDPQTLLILDLDRFKTVNDTIGHDGGDEVLRRIARVLRAACPPDGLVTRFGGEEFALLCPAGAAVTGDMLLAQVRETRMPYDLKVTASIGGCTGPLGDEKDWKALYRNADRALFAAKNAGRDRARTEVTALAA